jgi:hypothetical protein
MQLAKSILILIAARSLTACGSSKYMGKVVPGSVGRPIIVSASDDRINNDVGIEGLELTLYNEARSGQAPVQLTKTTTGEDGRFTFTLPAKKPPRGTVTVRVTGDSIYSARSKTYLPRNGQFMLFTVVTREAQTE